LTLSHLVAIVYGIPCVDEWVAIGGTCLQTRYALSRDAEGSFLPILVAASPRFYLSEGHAAPALSNASGLQEDKCMVTAFDAHVVRIGLYPFILVDSPSSTCSQLLQ
jgi:hypothetical protein